jgi:predicted enzyme related to lactoylglutathione lyase
MARVVHFEIHAENPERAIKFYSTIFGWEFSKWEGPADYWLIKTGPANEPGIDGGLVRRQGTLDGTAVIAYVCTLDVKSLDDCIAQVLKSGGQIVFEKQPVPGVGWLAYAKDLEGNIFGMMQADPNARM